MNGINIVIAESFARIFRQNMYNCGMIALELPPESLDEIFRNFAGKGPEGQPVSLAVDIEGGLLRFSSGGKEKSFPFKLEGFERALVEAGGWVEYAAQRY
jgi:3-isopropylmalate/(R)-2-methylmalate dehydratase small subunit